MKELYLDCQYGISGDMTLAALIGVGADLNYVIEHLRKLPIDSFEMRVKQVNKRGIMANQLQLTFAEQGHNDQIHNHHHDGEPHHHQGHSHQHHHHNDEQHEHRHDDGHSHHHNHGPHHHEHGHDDTYSETQGHHSHHHDHNDGHHHGHHHRKASDILSMIEQSDLPQRVKERSSAVFQAIAEAEGKIHGQDPKDVHFHEVGAMDSIIDIIGVCLALESLDIGTIIASPVPTGHGKIMIAHGLYPVPAPATAELLKGVPLLEFDVQGELTTPTGAGFLKALAKQFGIMPSGIIEEIGYGAGKKDFPHPNVVRAILFEQKKKKQSREPITILETQIDDMTGETFGFVLEKLLSEGALDAYFTPISMKKNRPGILITVLAKPQDADHLEELLFRETSTFGVRRLECSRRALERKWEEIETPFGSIKVKIGFENERIYQVSPEYEEVKKAALENNVPISEVYFSTQNIARKKFMQM